jgi:hypothetical protein
LFEFIKSATRNFNQTLEEIKDHNEGKKLIVGLEGISIKLGQQFDLKLTELVKILIYIFW